MLFTSVLICFITCMLIHNYLLPLSKFSMSMLILIPVALIHCFSADHFSYCFSFSSMFIFCCSSLLSSLSPCSYYPVLHAQLVQLNFGIHMKIWKIFVVFQIFWTTSCFSVLAPVIIIVWLPTYLHCVPAHPETYCIIMFQCLALVIIIISP